MSKGEYFVDYDKDTGSGMFSIPIKTLDMLTLFAQQKNKHRQLRDEKNAFTR